MKLKILLSLLCFGIVLSFALPHQSYAQTVSPSSASHYQMSEVEPDVPQNLNTYSQSVLIDFAGAIACQLVGSNPMRPNEKCLGVNPESGKIGFVEDGGGAIAVMGKMIGSLYYLPVGSGQYTQYMASNFIGNKKTYAADTSEVGGGNNPTGRSCEVNNPCPSGYTCKYPSNDDPTLPPTSVGVCVTARGNLCYTDTECALNEFCAPIDPQTNAGQCTTRPAGYTSPGTNTSPTPNPANGQGFGGLHPFLGIWTLFRNIAYLFYVAGFVLVGMGIVLRLPVDSRAVMSIQNQIPKIIVSLILLTFSYALVGLMIDIMYVIIFLVYNILSSNSTIASYNVSSLNPTHLQGTNPIGAIGGLGGIGGIANSTASSVGGLVGDLFSGYGGGIGSALVTGLIGAAVGFIVGGFNPITAAIGGALGAGGGLAGTGRIAEFAGHMIAFFVIAFALLSALFRIWFKLLSSYVLLLFTLVLAPFWIMGSIFPGVKFSFGGWFKTIIGHLSVFPTVVVMFMLGKAIMGAVIGAGTSGVFVPPLIGSAGGLEGLASIIGLGVILATPSIMDNIKGAFGTSGVPTQSIGQAIGTGQALGGTLLGGFRSALWSTNRHGHATGVINAFGMPWFWNRVGGGHSHTDDHGQALRPDGSHYAAGLAGGLQRYLDFVRRRRGNNATAANVAHTNGQNNNHNNDDDNNHGTGGNPATPPNPPHNPPPPPGFTARASGLVIPNGSGDTDGGTGTGGGTPPQTPPAGGNPDTGGGNTTPPPSNGGGTLPPPPATSPDDEPW